MAKKDRVYKWVKGLAQYKNLIRDLERRGWVHYLDYGRRSDAFRGAVVNGIVIGRRAEHPMGVDTYTVWKKK